jgi:hypothetical protein
VIGRLVLGALNSVPPFALLGFERARLLPPWFWTIVALLFAGGLVLRKGRGGRVVAGLLVVAVLLAHAAPPAWHRWQVWRAKRWCQELADRIEHQHAETGEYPASIQTLLHELGSRPPYLQMGPAYGLTELGFYLGFEVWALDDVHMESYLLDSQSRLWDQLGYIGPG